MIKLINLINVAAWGLAPEDTFRAIGAIMDMETEVPVNLVDVNTARSSLLAAIEREAWFDFQSRRRRYNSWPKLLACRAPWPDAGGCGARSPVDRRGLVP